MWNMLCLAALVPSLLQDTLSIHQSSSKKKNEQHSDQEGFSRDDKMMNATWYIKALKCPLQGEKGCNAMQFGMILDRHNKCPP